VVGGDGGGGVGVWWGGMGWGPVAAVVTGRRVACGCVHAL